MGNCAVAMAALAWRKILLVVLMMPLILTDGEA
jgi:hypothetical protein